MTISLRNRPRRTPPTELRSMLRVIASQERQRRLVRQSLRTWLRHFWTRTDLFLHHAMRATALPAAGGLCAAVFLFMMFVVPVYPLLAPADGVLDVPTMLSTEGSLKAMGGLNLGNQDVVVDVSVDGQGRMTDYAIVTGAAILAQKEVRRRLENTLLFSEFTPATSFGQPTSSRVRLWFHASQIEVKG